MLRFKENSGVQMAFAHPGDHLENTFVEGTSQAILIRKASQRAGCASTKVLPQRGACGECEEILTRRTRQQPSPTRRRPPGQTEESEPPGPWRGTRERTAI